MQMHAAVTTGTGFQGRARNSPQTLWLLTLTTPDPGVQHTVGKRHILRSVTQLPLPKLRRLRCCPLSGKVSDVGLRTRVEYPSRPSFNSKHSISFLPKIQLFLMISISWNNLD